MYIDKEKCIKCKKCVPYCPVNAIKEDDYMEIDLDLCVECGVCKKNAGCPKDAIYNVHLTGPRAYRKAFSDPFGKHENTTLKHMGRGTEEVKTNDVTGIVNKKDEVCVAIELGRPSVSATFEDLEKITKCVAPHIIQFEKNNPVTPLIIDHKIGTIAPEVIGERVLSAIVEFSCKLSNLETILKNLIEVAKDIDTVFSLCLISKVDEDTNEISAMEIINKLGIRTDKSSDKTNLGLGRPRYEDRAI